MTDPQPTAEGEQPTVSGSALTYSETQPGKWSPNRARHELQAEKEIRQQTEIERQAAFERQQRARDNDVRRRREEVGFYAILGVTGVILCLGVGLVLWSNDADTKTWARSLVTLVVGSIVGGLTGYLTGKGSK